MRLGTAFFVDLAAASPYAPAAMTRVGLALAALLVGCTHEGNFGPDANPDEPFPPPRTDLVPAVGSAATLELATWNIENFPGDPSSTPRFVADLVASLDLDVVVCQEIASEAAWAELVERLPEHEGVLSTHQYAPGDYQKIGVLYRSSLVTAAAPTLLFPGEEYAFPRPALSTVITVDDLTLELVGVHLKAGRADEDAARRAAAITAIDTHLRAQVDGGGEPDVVLLGDYNERVTDEEGRAVLGPLLAAPERYTVRTEPMAVSGAASFLNFGGTFIDHITTTAALDARWTGARVEVPALHIALPSYRAGISDHLPVVLIVPR